MNPVVCYLTEQHRQDDGQLLNVLTDIREGAVDDGDRNVLLTRLGAIPEPGQQAVNLLPPSTGRPTRLMTCACSKSRRSRTNTSPNPRVRRIWWNGSKKNMLDPPNGCVSRRARP